MTSNEWPVPNENIDYEKGENRRKHNGVLPQAAIVQEHGKLVGKCPRGFSPEVARSLVRNAIPEYRNTLSDKPFRLWNYHEGAIYVAYRTGDGEKNWHGFPALHPPPLDIEKALRERVREIGEESQLKRWLRKKW
jgi:hypothetical protein